MEGSGQQNQQGRVMVPEGKQSGWQKEAALLARHCMASVNTSIPLLLLLGEVCKLLLEGSQLAKWKHWFCMKAFGIKSLFTAKTFQLQIKQILSRAFQLLMVRVGGQIIITNQGQQVTPFFLQCTASVFPNLTNTCCNHNDPERLTD